MASMTNDISSMNVSSFTSAKAEKNKRKKDSMSSMAKKSLSAEQRRYIEDEKLLEQLAAENRVSGLKQKDAAADPSSASSISNTSTTLRENPSVSAIIVATGFSFEIRDTNGKGLGVFATKNVKSGTTILSEAPIIPGRPVALRLQAIFSVLSEERQQQVMDLNQLCTCNVNPCAETPLMRVYACNSYSTSKNTYLYRISARINHDCAPNACNSFTKDGIVVIKALKDIKAGEEITIMLADVWGKASDRRKILKCGFMGPCLCNTCKSFKSTTKPDDHDDDPVAASVSGPVIHLLTRAELLAARNASDWYDCIKNDLEKHTNKIKSRLQESAIFSLQFGGVVMESEADIVEDALKEWLMEVEAKNECGLSDESLVALGEDRKMHWWIQILKHREEYDRNARAYVEENGGKESSGA